MKHKTAILITLTSLTLLLASGFLLPKPVTAQEATTTVNESVFSSLGSAFSQLVTGSNTVRLDNPQNYFPTEKHPQFTLIALAAEDIQAKVIRNSLNKEIALKVEKQEQGNFKITFAEPFVILDNYTLDVVAKESFFYNRHIILEFAWGEVKPEEQAQTSWLKSFLEERPEYKNMPIVKKDAHSIHFQKPDGRIEANFSQNPINYKNDKGEWQPIDSTLKADGAAQVFTGSGIPVSIAKDGTVKAFDSSHSQKTTRFGYFDPNTKTFSFLEYLPEGTIKDNKYIRQTKEYKHVLTLLDTGLKEELILYSPPDTLSSSPNQWLVLETEVTGVDLPDGWIEKEYQVGDQVFPLPTTRDATGIEIETKRYAVKDSGKQYIYTGISNSSLSQSSYPLTIDPDFNGSTADGVVLRAFAGTYAEARSTSGYTNSTDTTMELGQRNSGTFSVIRNYLKFDTSSIGSNATTTQVNLSLVSTTDNSAVDFDVQIIKQDWSGQDPLTNGNREAAYDNCLSGTADLAVWRNTNGMSLNTQYASENLSTDWVNKTGSTYYSLRSSRDFSNTQPAFAVNETIYLASADHTTPAYRPVLTVEYSETPTPTPRPQGLGLSGLSVQGLAVGNVPWRCGDILTDSRDSKAYSTVLIGSQCWMATELNVGTRINGVIAQTNNVTLEKYCYNDLESNCTTYGGLYQWDETMQYAASCNGTGAGQPQCSSPVQGNCPTGWHIPSHYEWTAMELAICTTGSCITDFPYDESTLGFRGTDEGTKLKSGGSTNFNFLLGGNYASGFIQINSIGNIWSSTETSSTVARDREVSSVQTSVNRSQRNKSNANAVRCVKD